MFIFSFIRHSVVLRIHAVAARRADAPIPALTTDMETAVTFPSASLCGRNAVEGKAISPRMRSRMASPPKSSPTPTK